MSMVHTSLGSLPPVVWVPMLTRVHAEPSQSTFFCTGVRSAQKGICVVVLGTTFVHNHPVVWIQFQGPAAAASCPVIIDGEPSQAQQRAVICNNGEWAKTQVVPEVANSPHDRHNSLS